MLVLWTTINNDNLIITFSNETVFLITGQGKVQQIV